MPKLWRRFWVGEITYCRHKKNKSFKSYCTHIWQLKSFLTWLWNKFLNKCKSRKISICSYVNPTGLVLLVTSFDNAWLKRLYQLAIPWNYSWVECPEHFYLRYKDSKCYLILSWENELDTQIWKVLAVSHGKEIYGL